MMFHFFSTRKRLITIVCISALLLCATFFICTTVFDLGRTDNAEAKNYRSLITAVTKNDLKEIRKLANQPNFNVNAQDKNGKTALMFAASTGNIEAIKELVKLPNIDVNLPDKDGVTTLIFASYVGNLETIQELTKNSKIDGNLRDKYGFTALMAAAYMGHIDARNKLETIKDIDILLGNDMVHRAWKYKPEHSNN